MKTCTNCGIFKELTAFNKDKNASDLRQCYCRECVKIRRLERVEKHKQLQLLVIPPSTTTKKCGRCLQDKLISMFSRDPAKPDGLRYMCVPCLKEYRQLPEIKKQRVDYRAKTWSHWKAWYDSEEVTKRRKINKINYRPRHNELMKLRYKTNIGVKLRNLIRNRINCSLQTNKLNKIYSTIEYLGCNIEFFKLWMEFRFEEGMTWGNIGEWEIDHILPISKFDFTNPKAIEICFHWTNLQPLFKKENRNKSGKLEVHYYFNNIINVCRFNNKFKQFLGYQTMRESVQWLRDNKLRYGKNSPYNSNIVTLVPIELEMDNPQPSF